MTPEPGRRLAAAAIVASVSLFLIVRLLLIYVREPFFDELFTLWISSMDPASILDALTRDSGPPLYYAGVHVAFGISRPSIDLARLVSLGGSTALLLAILASRRLGESRWVAALFLAVAPAHAFLSAEARAYAWCSAFAGIGTLALIAWVEQGRRLALAGAVSAIVLAAYCHYYGVLFMPALLAVALLHPSERRRSMVRDATAATAATALLFLPGFRLATLQPVADAMRWSESLPDQHSAFGVFSALLRAGFTGSGTGSFLAASPVALQVATGAIVAFAFVVFGLRTPVGRTLGVITVVPVAGCALFALAGRPVYFPVRFEAVIAAPWVLWLAISLRPLVSRARGVLVAVLAGAGLFTCIATVLAQASQPPDPFRRAAIEAREVLSPGPLIVASGLVYLELISQRNARWSPSVETFPASQAEHPGWRAVTARPALEAELGGLLRRTPGGFVWVGELGSPEYAVLRSRCRMMLVRRLDPLVIVRVTPTS